MKCQELAEKSTDEKGRNDDKNMLKNTTTTADLGQHASPLLKVFPRLSAAVTFQVGDCYRRLTAIERLEGATSIVSCKCVMMGHTFSCDVFLMASIHHTLQNGVHQSWIVSEKECLWLVKRRSASGPQNGLDIGQ
uniref:Uncharacterized protein n=1 Tax=Sphaerodactylus townsendi TaxID=933632 RepID=A0ACB8FD28_9SAUR